METPLANGVDKELPAYTAMLSNCNVAGFIINKECLPPQLSSYHCLESLSAYTICKPVVMIYKSYCYFHLTFIHNTGWLQIPVYSSTEKENI